MKAITHLRLATTKEITDVIGLTPSTFNESYIKKPKKINMTTAIVYGSFMMMAEVTPDEIILAREMILAKRQADAKIKELNA